MAPRVALQPCWSARLTCSLVCSPYLQLIFSIIAFAVIAQYDGWSKGTLASPL